MRRRLIMRHGWSIVVQLLREDVAAGSCVTRKKEKARTNLFRDGTRYAANPGRCEPWSQRAQPARQFAFRLWIDSQFGLQRHRLRFVDQPNGESAKVLKQLQ